jgi:SOUL heme-binding protein
VRRHTDQPVGVADHRGTEQSHRPAAPRPDACGEDVSVEDLPDPLDSNVHTRRVSAETVAALRFSGRRSRSFFEKRLSNCSPPWTIAGLEVVGTPRYARFDPPWTPWFLRGNEVVVPVAA